MSTRPFPDSWPGMPAQTTAATFGRARMVSKITGPTLWTTTMVFLFTAATAWTRAFPLCHGSRLFRSPAFPSTVMYPSPESALMKTIAVAAALATDAPEDVESVVEVVRTVPSAAA